MKYLFILLLLVSGCGITIHSDPIKVDPIIVSYQVNLSMIDSYCENQCINNVDINICKRECINNILVILGAIAQR